RAIARIRNIAPRRPRNVLRELSEDWMKPAHIPTSKIEGVVPAFGELPIFAVGQSVKFSDRAMAR
ncbi:hypothetical protein ACC694_37820, partial [Rhizobium ruizarguesonis]